jgi:hypothetical protein
MKNMFNSIEDRALSEHRGSALLMKKSNGKYSILLPITGTGENGATPNQLDKTAIGNRQATSVEGRQDNPQKTLPFFAHRDNINVLEGIKGEVHDFLRLLPDFTGVKYSGTASYMLQNTDVGSLEQGQITITPTTSDEYVENCYDLIEDTVIFTSAIDEVVTMGHTGDSATKTIALSTNPSGATITATSDTTGTATVSYTSSTNSITITGVASGSAIVKLVASKSGYASFTRTILVVVE